MKYAVVQIAGHQYQVQEDQELVIDAVDHKEGDKFEVKDVLLVVDGEKRTVGAPLVDKAVVKLTVLKHDHDKKIRVATYKAKARQRKVRGHKQDRTTVKVTSISV